ncbi:Agd3-related carbohydrate-binding protein [Baekduia sp. Peel2402]|uniref:Agd3-related carbohydrate-binding protein n=1 Tax=Baekduia sp. Peel2402 TaxID=3458296 RepID=UPI00403EE059
MIARRVLIAAAALAGLAVPTAAVLAAAPNSPAPTQRLDAKVLLLSADGTEPGFAAWKAELTREGVPFEAVVAYTGATKTATLTDAKLADYGVQHAKYDAVILASGDLGHQVSNPGGTTSYLSALTDPEWAALAKFEQTFGVRQLSDYTAPSPAHGLVASGGASQDGKTGTLTAAGKAAFPYLKGPLPIPDDDPDLASSEAFGYTGTPVDPSTWQSLVDAPGGGSYLGIYTHPSDGREEMVMTVAGNENQSHVQLLRHGMLNWVTRGVFLGFQRHYLELQIDDLFLGDDAWDPTTHTTNYDPAAASRMTASDVARAVQWSSDRGVRLDFAFNGGGSALWQDQTGASSDPLVTAIQANKGAFGFINHTYEHPNLDCSSAAFIAKQINDNKVWAAAHGLTIDPTELVTGEHSGLANSRPGNPGTIDPPSIDDVEPTTGTTTPGPTPGVPTGTYDYALSARSSAGESTASTFTGVAVGAAGTTGNTVDVSFNAVCHAISYQLYRRTASTGAWSLIGTLARPGTAATDDGTDPVVLTITDDQATGTAGTPPAANGAALAPYPQNPNYLTGVTGAGVRFIATDASKTYPQDPANVAGPQWGLAATFTEGTPPASFRAVPRYPSNVYYNVSRQGQQLDEYNWIYVLPANGGGCVPIEGVTTCRTTLATWDEYVRSENTIMFRHLMGNDPRPHYMHQSNLADYIPSLPETDPGQGGVLYPVVDGLLGRYDAAINRAKAPLVQLTSAQVADTLARQETWAAHLAAGDVTAWLQDGQLHVKNASSGAVEVPLTGTTAGDLYAGQRSGWKTIAAGAEVVLAPDEPANTAAPVLDGTPRAGEKLTASTGRWTGTAPITYTYQWQRCDAAGDACRNVAGATGSSYDVGAVDVGARLRVVVSAGNWIASVSQAPSAGTATVAKAPEDAKAKDDGGGSGAGGGGRPVSGQGQDGKKPSSSAVALTLTKVTMSPRRFALAHRVRPRGTRLDGSRVSWRLNKAATVKLVVQRQVGAKGHKRWITVGTIRRAAAKGNGVLRFTGRFKGKPLAPRAYRLTLTATAGRQKAGPKRVAFRVVVGR